MTATAADLQSEFRGLYAEWRQTGENTYQVRLAYNAWFHQSCLEGKPPDGLRRDAGTEAERFFARTIHGLDGCTYWDGPLERGSFRIDGNRRRHPRWWWYEHVNGKQERGKLGAVCGQINCITPEHQQFVPWSEVKRRYTDEQMLGALQVVAQELGRAPLVREYAARRRKPGHDIIQTRFGGWMKALRAAGLEPEPQVLRTVATEEQLLDALRFCAELVGHAPTEDEFRAHNRELQAEGLRSSPSTIYRRLGSWPIALRKAGLT